MEKNKKLTVKGPPPGFPSLSNTDQSATGNCQRPPVTRESAASGPPKTLKCCHHNHHLLQNNKRSMRHKKSVGQLDDYLTDYMAKSDLRVPPITKVTYHNMPTCKCGAAEHFDKNTKVSIN